MKCLIVIVNYNSWTDTLLCLKSIMVTGLSEIEVVVVDNGSNDLSVQNLREYSNTPSLFSDLAFPDWFQPDNKFCFIPYHVLSLKENKGLSAGFNHGVRFMSSYKSLKEYSYFWFLNNDTLIQSSTLISLIKTLNRDNVGLAGSVVLNFDGKHEIQTYAGTLSLWTSRNQAHKCSPTPNSRKLMYPSGVSLLISFEKFELLNGFDEDYFLYYEELDLVKRLASMGYVSIVDKDSRLWHKQGASTNSKRHQKKLNLNVERHKFRSAKIFFKKHYPKRLILLYAHWVLKLFFYSFNGRLPEARMIFSELKS